MFAATVLAIGGFISLIGGIQLAKKNNEGGAIGFGFLSIVLFAIMTGVATGPHNP
jgi:hypothetical protein